MVLVALTLLYIFLLTLLFEYSINKSSSTWLTVAGVSLFFVLSYLYAQLFIKIFKNRL